MVVFAQMLSVEISKKYVVSVMCMYYNCYTVYKQMNANKIDAKTA